jgi:hypothetical protein
MIKTIAIVSAVLIALATTAGGPASAQTIVYEAYQPIVAPAYVVPAAPIAVESYRPVIAGSTYNPPVSSPNFTAYTSNYRGTTSYYAPAPASAVTAYSPITTYSPIVTAAPVTAYRPVVTTYSPVVTSYAPVTSYRPVVTSYYTPYVVRSKVFVPGEPVRNFFRAITP